MSLTHRSQTTLPPQQHFDPTRSLRRTWELLLPRLLGLARKVLAGYDVPTEAEDVVQVVFLKFFRYMEVQQVRTDWDEEELWRLLSMFTAQEARKQVRREYAHKRGAGRTMLEVDFIHVNAVPSGLDHLAGRTTTPDDNLLCEDLLNQIEPGLRQIAVLRLAGYTNREIHARLGVPLRSIERRVRSIRDSWSYLD